MVERSSADTRLHSVCDLDKAQIWVGNVKELRTYWMISPCLRTISTTPATICSATELVTVRGRPASKSKET